MKWDIAYGIMAAMLVFAVFSVGIAPRIQFDEATQAEPAWTQYSPSYRINDVIFMRPVRLERKSALLEGDVIALRISPANGEPYTIQINTGDVISIEYWEEAYE